jgi:hypothetical protein
MNLLQRCLAALQPSMVGAGAATTAPPGPYAQPALNRLYEMLFCDRPELTSRRQPARPRHRGRRCCSAPSPRPIAIRALADDSSQEPRVRALAFDWLRRHGHEVPARRLLGVVLEVPLDGGLDVLAVYLDGSVRYLNHAAAPALFEGPVPTLQPHVQRLLSAAQAIVDRIGPSDQPRRPAPRENVRLNFLVSDGLYFGEGPMQTLQRDAMAGPLIDAGAALLAEVVTLTARRAH